jgi:hypothetical protein
VRSRSIGVAATPPAHTGTRRRRWFVASAVLALALLASAPAANSASASGATRSGDRLAEAGSVGFSASQGVPVTMPPVGLSIEYPLIANYLGTGPCPPPALVAELLKLGPAPLALSGVSQDLTAPNGALTGSPSSWEAATLYPLPVNFWTQLHCLLAATKAPLTVGINLRSGQASWATQLLAAAQTAAANGVDFSLGNEPDLYVLPNYSSLGKPVTIENVAAVTLYLKLVSSLRQALGGVRVVGPELAGPRHWRRQLPRVISELHPQTVGVHLYPLSSCQNPGSPTVRKLLSPRAADAPRSLAWVVGIANAGGVPAIISEANSVACGGTSGVSDSPAAAVWAVRFVINALKSGFREVRFHLSGGPYDPFIVAGAEVIARPLERALTALNRWLPVGASLRTLAGVKGVLATVVTGAPAGRRVIFDNEQGKAQTLALPASHPLAAEAYGPSQAGPQIFRLPARAGRVKIRVPGNSVLTVTFG